MLQRVLIQWLPNDSLRQERALTMGGKYGSEVQLTSLDVHYDSYAKAATLAKRVPEFQEMLLQIGFEGRTRYWESGWLRVDAEGQPLPDQPYTYRFEDTLSRDDLVYTAWELALAQASPEERQHLLATEARIEQLKVEQMAAQTAQAEKEVAVLGSHPLFSMDAFNQAAVAIYPAWYWQIVGWVLGWVTWVGSLGGLLNGSSAAKTDTPELAEPEGLKLKRQ